jgi:NAD(P)-dependent dehydrogenase (short-subunit alcohol dehydrogenase family)
MTWQVSDMPMQTGRVAIVTGANSGIGYHTAFELARAGATVILACRSETKGLAALGRIQGNYSGAKLSFEALDLSSLASVAAFAARIKAAFPAIDLLINNAGVMALPARQVTQDGFEMQLGVNFLGHFALTAHLLPLLRAAKKPRIINLSSIAHRRGMINLDDLQSERNYRPWTAYSQSKLAMLMFSLALQRRSETGQWGVTAMAAHPGFARTELIANGPGAGAMATLSNVFAPLISQSAAAGALPTLYAATSQDAAPGGYYGPAGLFELKGPPGPAKIMPQARDADVLRKLWERAEVLTSVAFKPAP